MPILVGGFKHFFYVIIYGIVLPIDELHHFSRWLKPPASILSHDYPIIIHIKPY